MKIVVLVSSMSTALMAQVNTSTLAGLVKDESGASVPNAKVTATMLATGQQRTTMSNESGEFVVPQLAPGGYRLSVTAQGFQTIVVDNIALNIAGREIVNINLKVGQVNEQVTVEAAAAPLLEQETASLGQVITRKAIADLDWHGPNYTTAGALSPDALPHLPSGTGPSSFIAATTSRSDRSLLVGGQRESSTSYLFDGVEMRNPRIGDSSITPSLDVVQEFKIQRNFFQAEFGNSPGIINVARRGGANQFHSSLFHFLRNDKMDARNFFSPGVPLTFEGKGFRAARSPPSTGSGKGSALSANVEKWSAEGRSRP